MAFMNEMDVEEAADFLTSTGHRAAPWAEALRDFMYAVNRNSDGWCYWQPATHAANALMTCVQWSWDRARYPRLFDNRRDPRYIPEPTEADYAKAYRKVLAFCREQNLPIPHATPYTPTNAEVARALTGPPGPIGMTGTSNCNN